VGEFEDNALLNVFGQSGAGLFVASSAIEKEVQEQYNVSLVGQLGISESFYAISIERRIKHPAVAAIVEAARSRLFKMNSEYIEEKRNAASGSPDGTSGAC